jgi:sarcosine oxidase subunit alpha
MRGHEIAEHLREQLVASAAVHVHSEATAFGVYNDGFVGIRQKDTLIKMRAQRLIVATGAYENALIAENWDRPGVFLASGVQRMLHLWKMWPGSATVVISTSDYGLAVAAQLIEAGAEVKAVADARERIDHRRRDVMLLRERGVPLLTLHTLKAVHGWNQVTSAELSRVDGVGQLRRGTELTVPCDAIVVAVGFSPANELVFQATAKGSYTLESTGTLSRIPYQYDDMRVNEEVYVAGNAGGVVDAADVENALLEGELAGLSAALSLGAKNEVAKLRQEELRQLLSAKRRRRRRSRATRPLVAPDLNNVRQQQSR